MLQKTINRLRRKARVRSTIHGTQSKPRLSVFRSGAHIYAQIIDDDAAVTLASSNDLKISSGTKTEKAAQVGAELAKAALEKKISEVVFDRGGFVYHGRVKALADAAREAGLKF